MASVNELIEALMEIYFEEENTCERYKIFAAVEEAMNHARAVTCEQIANLEGFRSLFPEVEDADAKVLAEMSKVVATAAMVDEVCLTRETTIGEIAQIGDIDSLDMVEIVMTFEGILNIDIDTDVSHEATVGDFLDQRK